MQGEPNDHEHTPDLDRPSLSWEEIEGGKAGQLPLPIAAVVPTAGERTFLALARRWHDEMRREEEGVVGSRSTDEIELSCLLLAVDGGVEFTTVARSQICKNEEYAATEWTRELPWSLCWTLVNQVASGAMDDLIGNLGHHYSTIRNNMVALSWITRASLDASRAVPVPLKNVSDTLVNPFNSAGLATALLPEEEFWKVARKFQPPLGFEKQYENRLKLIQEMGALWCQAPLWKLEAESRRRVCLEVASQRTITARPQQGSRPVA